MSLTGCWSVGSAAMPRARRSQAPPGVISFSLMVCSILALGNSFLGVNNPSTVSSWLLLMPLLLDDEDEEVAAATPGETGDE